MLTLWIESHQTLQQFAWLDCLLSNHHYPRLHGRDFFGMYWLNDEQPPAMWHWLCIPQSIDTSDNEAKSKLLTHHGLAFRHRLGARNNSSDIIFESFVKHAVRLIQHQVINPKKWCQLSSLNPRIKRYVPAEITRPFLHQIQNASWRPDNYPCHHSTLGFRRVLEHFDLGTFRNAAKNGYTGNAERLSKCREGIVGLNSEFSSRCNHEDRDRRLFWRFSWRLN